MLISAPLLAIGSTAYAIYLLGAWALIGLGVLFLLLPLQVYVILFIIILTEYRPIGHAVNLQCLNSAS